jgi:transmembrane sensor
MGKDRIFYLLQQYSSNRASKEEVEEMFGLLVSAQNAEVLKSLIVHEGKDGEREISLPPGDWDRIWSAIRSEAILPARKRVFSMGWMRVAAAAILLVTGSATYLVFSKGKIKAAAPLANNHYKNDILPGGNKAVLTLANGSTIVLDSAHNGLIGQQGNIRILKMDAGMLAYKMQGKYCIIPFQHPVAGSTR